MSMPNDEPNVHMQLRNEAKTRLEAGTAAYSNWSLSVDALHMLYKLSSDPETAGDAIKLLHELQLHQVELELQHEEMLANEQHLDEELSRYKELFELAPFGYFLVDFQGEVIESNRAGAALFGVERDELTGGRIDRFLAAESRSVLLGLLKSLEEDGVTQACEVTTESAASSCGPLRVVANVSPDRRGALLACCECP